MEFPCGHSVVINLPDEVFSAFLTIAEAIIQKNRCFTFDRQPACKNISFEIIFTASNPTSFQPDYFIRCNANIILNNTPMPHEKQRGQPFRVCLCIRWLLWACKPKQYSP
ncbi:MAG: hypothetical protein JW798_03290 [Prolixibacteraceae bacterium]|nr:hypothetical protein [Prolixibacteraceae bacterium]